MQCLVFIGHEQKVLPSSRQIWFSAIVQRDAGRMACRERDTYPERDERKDCHVSVYQQGQCHQESYKPSNLHSIRLFNCQRAGQVVLTDKKST